MPTTTSDRRRSIEGVLRLRRAARIAEERTRAEIEPVLAFLEESVGPTVSRAEAARLLGISRTALDRWIDKGEISSVLTPQGRREIPLAELLDLLEQVEQTREAHGQLAVAVAIRDRRTRAEAIDLARLVPQARPGPHRRAELLGLAYHRLVARRLDAQLVDDARRRLRRWREEGRIHPRWADEWERILALPLPRIARTIGAEASAEPSSGRARRSPALSPSRSGAGCCGRSRTALPREARAPQARHPRRRRRHEGRDRRRRQPGDPRQYPQAPDSLLVSIEADLYPRTDPQRTDEIDAELTRERLAGVARSARL